MIDAVPDGQPKSGVRLGIDRMIIHEVNILKIFTAVLLTLGERIV